MAVATIQPCAKFSLPRDGHDFHETQMSLPGMERLSLAGPLRFGRTWRRWLFRLIRAGRPCAAARLLSAWLRWLRRGCGTPRPGSPAERLAMPSESLQGDRSKGREGRRAEGEGVKSETRYSSLGRCSPNKGAEYADTCFVRSSQERQCQKTCEQSLAGERDGRRGVGKITNDIYELIVEPSRWLSPTTNAHTSRCSGISTYSSARIALTKISCSLRRDGTD